MENKANSKRICLHIVNQVLHKLCVPNRNADDVLILNHAVRLYRCVRMDIRMLEVLYKVILNSKHNYVHVCKQCGSDVLAYPL